jgi:hypothetical protein
MAAVIVRRMRMIRARAQRLASQGRDSPMYSADDDTESPQMPGTTPGRTSVINVDFGDLTDGNSWMTQRRPIKTK